MLPDGVRAVVEKNSYPIPPIFDMLSSDGDIEEEMMYNTFNMGIGMMIAVSPDQADRAVEAVKAAGEIPYLIGKLEAGEKGVTLC